MSSFQGEETRLLNLYSEHTNIILKVHNHTCMRYLCIGFMTKPILDTAVGLNLNQLFGGIDRDILRWQKKEMYLRVVSALKGISLCILHKETVIPHLISIRDYHF